MRKNSKSTFKDKDVMLLLADITGTIEPMPTKEREALIQSGVHYSEMLPLESKPTEQYLSEYYRALELFSDEVALAIKIVSQKIYMLKGGNPVLVSLARAGTPIGILIKRYLKLKYNYDAPHYTISIVRGRGIDKVAMKYILEHHSFENIQFVDGWTGKGAILNELAQAISEFADVNERDKKNLLAVVADPANVTDMCGTHKDLPIASSFLNSTVCGLMSRTIIHQGIEAGQLHGVVFFEDFKSEDRTYEFIHEIESKFEEEDKSGIDEVLKISVEFDVKDINFIKPGIGETTRVLLRRVPDMVLVADEAPAHFIAHIMQLAKEKNVEVVRYPLKNYYACGIIKSLNSDL